MSLVEVGRFFDLMEAQVAASALRASGVAVVIQGESYASLLPATGIEPGIVLLTPETDAAIARQILAGE